MDTNKLEQLLKEISKIVLKKKRKEREVNILIYSLS